MRVCARVSYQTLSFLKKLSIAALTLPAVGPTAHRLNHAVVCDSLPVAAAGVLAPAVGAHDQPAPGLRRQYADLIAWQTRSALIRSLID